MNPFPSLTFRQLPASPARFPLFRYRSQRTSAAALFSLSSMVAETSKDGYNEEHFQKSGRDPHD